MSGYLGGFMSVNLKIFVFFSFQKVFQFSGVNAEFIIFLYSIEKPIFRLYQRRLL